jgi:hypothetical protein
MENELAKNNAMRKEELKRGAPNMARDSVLRDYRQHSGSPKKGHSTEQKMKGRTFRAFVP